jgi:hypothetical protein
MRNRASRAVVVFASASALAACATDESELGSTESAVDINDFQLPSLAAPERAQIVHKYDALDPNDDVPRGLLEDTIIYFDVNKAQIPKTSYFVVVDLMPYSGKDRYWLVNLSTGAVEKHKVAHGDGSDPDNNGYATSFGNVDGSHKSSLGFYLTGEIYDGTHPHSMRLDGLSVDGSPNGMANTNVRDRLIVMHEATYVDDGNSSQQGRSNGCLALDPSIELGMVNKIHDGTLLYTAISSLNPPVGRAACGDSVCDGGEDITSCPADCTGGMGSGSGSGSGSDGPGDDPGTGDDGGGAGGCSTSGGSAGLMFALALVGLRSRRGRRSI